MVSGGYWFGSFRVSQMNTVVHGPMSWCGWPSGKGNGRVAEGYLECPDKQKSALFSSLSIDSAALMAQMKSWRFPERLSGACQ
jgi:hypothetical protein